MLSHSSLFPEYVPARFPQDTFSTELVRRQSPLMINLPTKMKNRPRNCLWGSNQVHIYLGLMWWDTALNKPAQGRSVHSLNAFKHEFSRLFLRFQFHASSLHSFVSACISQQDFPVMTCAFICLQILLLTPFFFLQCYCQYHLVETVMWCIMLTTTF